MKKGWGLLIAYFMLHQNLFGIKSDKKMNVKTKEFFSLSAKKFAELLSDEFYNACAQDYLHELLERKKELKGLPCFLEERILSAQMILDDKASQGCIDGELYMSLYPDFFVKSVQKKSNKTETWNNVLYYEWLYALLIDNVTACELNNKIKSYEGKFHPIEEKCAYAKNLEKVPEEEWYDRVRKKYTNDDILCLKLIVSKKMSQKLSILISTLQDVIDKNYGECAICLESLTFKNTFIVPCCKQGIHKKCLCTWAKIKKTCPLCKNLLDFD